MSKERFNWKFEYMAKDLIETTQKKIQYHREREKTWNTDYLKALDDLKELGVDIRTYQVTGGEMADIVVDPQRKEYLQLCFNKKEDHRKEAEAYEMYLRAFELNKEEKLVLGVEDIFYFGL
ncbi:hypothetical protein IIA15_11425 [candidate division TA06 bacterium]|nr:hypothetical protein [candidate division TA06 bacterium]